MPSPSPPASDEDSWPGCAFIAAPDWEPGAAPYCGAPVRPGSPYCAAHHRLCYLDPESAVAHEAAQAEELALNQPSRRVRCLALSDPTLESDDETSARATVDAFCRDTPGIEESEEP